jgi:hypothetical protein
MSEALTSGPASCDASGAETRDPLGDGLRRGVERARRSRVRQTALDHAARHRLSTFGVRDAFLCMSIRFPANH